jgi:hypothetical protein
MKTNDCVMKATNGNMPRTLVQHRMKDYEICQERMCNIDWQ